MAIKLISDSTCDLTPELLERYDITLAPLYVTQDGVTRRDGVDIHPQDIFDHVAAGGSLPSTSAVNIADYQELFSKYAQEYEAVIHFNIGQGFSACHQNAVIAAEDFDNVYVVDTRNLTMGQGLLVVEAAEAARSVSRGVYVCFPPPWDGGPRHRGDDEQPHRQGGHHLRGGPAGLFGQGGALLLCGGPGGQPAQAQALHRAV